METDENGLYYMRARYYNTDIKRFINRDIIDRTIQNSQSLNKYSYVQGNPISLTDPFGLCPDFSGIMEYLKMAGHTLLDIAGFIPVVGFVADLANAYWYYCEGNTQMAMASVISAIPGMGDAVGAVLKGAGMVTKCQKLVKAADVVIDTCRFAGAVAQTGLNVSNLQTACKSVAEEYRTTGKVSFWNGANLALSAVGVGVGAVSIASSARNFNRTQSVYSNRNIQNTESVKYKVGSPVAPMEMTYEMRLNPEGYVYEIAQKYGINLRGSGKNITIRVDATLARGTYGKSSEANPTEIVLGLGAFQDEGTLANTIAHELSHCRDFIRGAGIANPQLHKPHGNVDSLNLPGEIRTAYGAGNALESYIKGER